MRRRPCQPRRALVVLGVAVVAALVPCAAIALPQADAAPQQDLGVFLAEALRRSPRLYPAQDAYDQAVIGREVTAARFNTKVTPFFSADAERYGPSGPSFGVDLQKILPTGTTLRLRADSFGYDLGPTSYRDNGYSFWISHPIIASLGPEPRHEITNARRAVDAAANRLRETRQRLVLEVAQAYFNIVRQQRLVEASRVAVERAERLKTASEARMQVGLATKLDVLRADLFLSQAQAGLEDRRTALADAEDLLKLLTGRPLNARLSIAGDDLDDFTTAYRLVPAEGGALVQRVGTADDPDAQDDGGTAGRIDAEAGDAGAPAGTLVFAAAQQAAALGGDAPEDLRPFIATALGNRIDVIEARARVADADRAAAVATWRLLPQINLNASYTDRGLWSPQAPAFGDLFGGFSVGVSTSYSLDRSAERAAFSRAGIGVRAAERALAELQDRVIAEVRRAHRGIERADKAIAIQGKAVELSETQLELAQLRYERGLADNFDVVDAESNYFTSQSALVSARVDRALAGLALDLAMGLIDPSRYAR